MSTVPAAETFSFQAEVSQVLDLVIHSLYAHKEVFLRELVSNASDALDKLRFRALTEPEVTSGDATLEIRIAADPEASTLTIEDTGVGMTRDDLVKHLGTIAHSGTKAFAQAMKAAGKADAAMIGQFGVGFYSAYLVARRVEVTSRAAGAAESWRWSSDAKGAFVVEPATREARGTAVTLHLNPEQKQLLEGWRLTELVRRYSDFVGYPIKLQRAGTDGATWETVNRASALWQRPRAEITEDQHAEFYKHLTKDGESPLARTHFAIEGTQVFTALLYLPRKAPAFDAGSDRRGVRLFVKRVFVMDDCPELLPSWMRFVRGVVDSDDLPLNVSREVLQDSAIVRTIKKQVTKKVLDLLDELAKERQDDYATFFAAWGTAIKEAVATDWEHRERFASLLRYASSKGDGPVSLARYVERMPLAQPAIYYVLGASEASLAASPHIEALAKRGWEVLYMTDPIDEWAADAVGKFEGKPLVSAMRADLALGGQADPETTSAARDLGALAARAKEVLGDAVAEVRLSDRLTDSACCLVVADGEHHAWLEQMLRASGRDLPKGKRVLELNPNHPLIASLRTLTERDPKSDKLGEWIELLHDQALLTEGGRIADPHRFARRMTDLLAAAAGRAATESH